MVVVGIQFEAQIVVPQVAQLTGFKALSKAGLTRKYEAVEGFI